MKKGVQNSQIYYTQYFSYRGSMINDMYTVEMDKRHIAYLHCTISGETENAGKKKVENGEWRPSTFPISD